MIISQIVAVAENGVIGRENDLPWHLPDDMEYFKTTTRGHHVLMGRKNFYSIPHKFRPLPGRPNIVVSRNKDLQIDGVTIVNSIEDGINIAREAGEEELFIIGGGEIFRQAMDLCDRLYITQIHGTFDGDVFYPDIDNKSWEETSRVPHPGDDRHKYSFDFVIFERRS